MNFTKPLGLAHRARTAVCRERELADPDRARLRVPFAVASASVSPTDAISGHVYTTDGIVW